MDFNGFKKGELIKISFLDNFRLFDEQLDDVMDEELVLEVFGRYAGENDRYLFVKFITVPKDSDPPWQNILAVVKGNILDIKKLAEVGEK